MSFEAQRASAFDTWRRRTQGIVSLAHIPVHALADAGRDPYFSVVVYIWQSRIGCSSTLLTWQAVGPCWPTRPPPSSATRGIAALKPLLGRGDLRDLRLAEKLRLLALLQHPFGT